MIVSSFCFALKCVHVTSCYLSARVHGHRTHGRCWRRAQAMAGLLLLASSRAWVMPRSAYGLAWSGPSWLWLVQLLPCTALAQLATRLRYGCGCIARSTWCPSHPSYHLPHRALVKALVWFWLIDETLSANLVYQSDYEIGSTTPSEAMAKIMTMVMAW